jgi:hypothetical protein
MRSFEEEQLLLDGITDVAPGWLLYGDTAENLVNKSIPGEAVRENYRQQGRDQERERIIKLLTDNDVVGANFWIALIKGDNW